MIGRTVVGVLSAVALVAWSAPASAQRSDSGGVTLRIPPSVGPFAMKMRKDMEQADAGTMLRFVRDVDSLSADVFLYAGPDLATACPLECSRTLLDSEISEFIGFIPELVRLHYVDSMSVIGDDTLVAGAADRWVMGRHLTLHQRHEGRSEESHFYLYYLPGVRVKVRASFVPDTSRTRAVADFAAGIVPALTAPAPVTSAEEPRHMAIDVTLPGGARDLFARAVAVLGKAGYTIADSSLADGRLVTAPRFAWPLGSEKESWHGTESPGVSLRIDLAPAGDSTRLTVSGRSPTRADWTDAKVAQQLELLSVLQMASDLAPDEKKPPKKKQKS